MLTPTDKAAIEGLIELGNKFRPGRWMTVSDWNRYAVMEENHPHERFVCTFNQKPVSMQGRKIDPVEYCGADRTTAEFIAAAKNALPALQRLLAGETREADKPAGVPVSELLDLHNWCREQVEVIARNPCAPAVVGEAYDEAANRLYKLISRHQDPHHG